MPSFTPLTLPDFDREGPSTEGVATQRDHINPLVGDEKRPETASSMNPMGHFDTESMGDEAHHHE